MAQYYSEHSKHFVSVDCIIFGFDGDRLRILIGRRKMDPGRGDWALYGGFVEEGEDLDAAARRVLRSLTGMEDVFMRQVRTFGEVGRDPGARVISVAYCAIIQVTDYEESLRQKYGLEWVDVNALPALYSDHLQMVGSALRLLRRNVYSASYVFSLLPAEFTLTQFQHLVECILGEPVDKRNFRKKLKALDFIEPTGGVDRKSSKRGAALYRRIADTTKN